MFVRVYKQYSPKPSVEFVQPCRNNKACPMFVGAGLNSCCNYCFCVPGWTVESPESKEGICVVSVFHSLKSTHHGGRSLTAIQEEESGQGVWQSRAHGFSEHETKYRISGFYHSSLLSNGLWNPPVKCVFQPHPSIGPHGEWQPIPIIGYSTYSCKERISCVDLKAPPLVINIINIMLHDGNFCSFN